MLRPRGMTLRARRLRIVSDLWWAEMQLPFALPRNGYGRYVHRVPITLVRVVDSATVVLNTDERIRVDVAIGVFGGLRLHDRWRLRHAADRFLPTLDDIVERSGWRSDGA